MDNVRLHGELLSFADICTMQRPPEQFFGGRCIWYCRSSVVFRIFNVQQQVSVVIGGSAKPSYVRDETA